MAHFVKDWHRERLEKFLNKQDMKNFVTLKVECYTAEGMEVFKYDEDRASEEHVVFKDTLIDFNHVESIQPGVKDPSKSVLTMTSGSDFVVNGTPREILANVRTQYSRFPVITRHPEYEQLKSSES